MDSRLMLMLILMVGVGASVCVCVWITVSLCRAGTPGASNTCGLSADGVTLANNSANHGGSQLYSSCGGNLSLTDTSVAMSGASEVGRSSLLTFLVIGARPVL
jgi:hypothetical protein